MLSVVMLECQVYVAILLNRMWVLPSLVPAVVRVSFTEQGMVSSSFMLSVEFKINLNIIHSYKAILLYIFNSFVQLIICMCFE